MTRKCLLFESPPRSFRSLQQRPVPELESGLPVFQCRAEALYEVLVGVGRMQLHQRNPLLRPRQMLRQLLRDVGLPRPRRPLEDDLLLVVEQGFDLLKELDGEVHSVGELWQGRQWWWSRVVCLRWVVIIVLDFPVVAHDSPYHRLRVKTVAYRQPTLLGFLNEPVEESESMLVQRRLVRVRIWLAVYGTCVCVGNDVDPERRVPLDVQPHQQDWI